MVHRIFTVLLRSMSLLSSAYRGSRSINMTSHIHQQEGYEFVEIHRHFPIHVHARGKNMNINLNYVEVYVSY
jgi:hypothetical protein